MSAIEVYSHLIALWGLKNSLRESMEATGRESEMCCPSAQRCGRKHAHTCFCRVCPSDEHNQTVMLDKVHLYVISYQKRKGFGQ
jgi:hypothetical protein